jgi:hypothetical protein
MVSDLRFRDGLLVSYRLPRDHTEISLCMDGAMRALETDALEVNFGKGELCVLAPGGVAKKGPAKWRILRAPVQGHFARLQRHVRGLPLRRGRGRFLGGGRRPMRAFE